MKKISPLPNIMSIIRVFLAPFLFFSIKNSNIMLIVIIAAIAILTDILDGFLARKLDSITEKGKILDPLADKICIAAAAIAAALYGDLPLMLLVVIIARDLVITVGGLSIIKTKHEIPVSNFWGKITVIVLSAALIIYVFKFNQFYMVAFWAVIIFVIASLISYFFTGLKFISNNKLNNISC
ncbi:MAG: CDP-alcohol phosphatidyltransferase family protein [candidate division Zixibacteria bacterium]|nr:CDP-alcohol phosphatidyltransferase family protein [candidate division Zixibacteria bacterium]